MHHRHNSNVSESSLPSYTSSDQPIMQDDSSWGTTNTNASRYREAQGASYSCSSGYPPSSNPAGVPWTFTYTPVESKGGFSPRPLPLSPPPGYMGWSGSSSSSSTASTPRGDEVWHAHGISASPTRPLLDPTLIWGQCSVAFDLGTPPRLLNPSLAGRIAFPGRTEAVRILFRNHPEWSMMFQSTNSFGQPTSVLDFLKYLHLFIRGQAEDNQYSLSMRTDDMHEAGKLPRIASPHPSFTGVTSNTGQPRVVDRRAQSKASAPPGPGQRVMRRYDLLGSKTVFAGLIPPQHPQDGSAWYVVLAEPNQHPNATPRY